jgi:hypothetical protein
MGKDLIFNTMKERMIEGLLRFSFTEKWASVFFVLFYFCFTLRLFVCLCCFFASLDLCLMELLLKMFFVLNKQKCGKKCFSFWSCRTNIIDLITSIFSNYYLCFVLLVSLWCLVSMFVPVLSKAILVYFNFMHL